MLVYSLFIGGEALVTISSIIKTGMVIEPDDDHLYYLKNNYAFLSDYSVILNQWQYEIPIK